MLSLTRAVRFPAVHRMFRPDWTEDENRKHFGPVAEYHEHEYTCEVTVAGAADPTTGMLVDLGELDRILLEEVVSPLAGKRLNTEVPGLAGGRPLPTCETLASFLYGRIAARLPSAVRLTRVRVAEDPTLYAEYTGDS